jgi:predicted adenine nucleotide alpha hydrolase (AANH) superfamily ATPase
MPILRLRDEGFRLIAWFMNPNIQPLAEYLRRREAARQACDGLGVDLVCDDAAWDITAWLRSVTGRDTKPDRCVFCCGSRLQAAFAKARGMGIPHVSSSLLYSRYQPHEMIAAEGARLGQAGSPSFVYRDFRRDWQEGFDRSRAMGLYRQAWCGCVYSEADRYAKRLAAPRGRQSSGAQILSGDAQFASSVFDAS